MNINTTPKREGKEPTFGNSNLLRKYADWKPSRKTKKGIGILTIFLLLILAGSYIEYTLASEKRLEKAKAYENPQLLQQTVREDSINSIQEKSVIEYAEDTQLLRTQSEILGEEAKVRKQVIQDLFSETDTENNNNN